MSFILKTRRTAAACRMLTPAGILARPDLIRQISLLRPVNWIRCVLHTPARTGLNPGPGFSFRPIRIIAVSETADLFLRVPAADLIGIAVQAFNHLGIRIRRDLSAAAVIIEIRLILNFRFLLN